MRWKLETIRYAQGWLSTQLQTMNDAAIAASPDPDNSVLEFHGAVRTMEQIVAQWVVVDQALDDALAENAQLRRRLEGIVNMAEQNK